MQGNGIAFCGSATSLEVRYTDKPVSGWGGLVAVQRYLEKRGVGEVLAQALPDGRTSPNQIPVLDIAWAFFSTVLTGGRRFAHLERLRSDEVVQAILGVTRMPSAMTLTRYFGGLVRSQIEHLSAVLGQFVLGGLRAPALGAVLDLDSTVFERYGRQQGSLKGYNPRKHGRPSHHPLLAMLAEAKLVVHAWLRRGNTASARGVKAFLAETLARLPADFRLYALRADSGFFITEFSRRARTPRAALCDRGADEPAPAPHGGRDQAMDALRPRSGSGRDQLSSLRLAGPAPAGSGA
jgi:Transposase DDE domain group 1